MGGNVRGRANIDVTASYCQFLFLRAPAFTDVTSNKNVIPSTDALSWMKDAIHYSWLQTHKWAPPINGFA